MIAAFVRKNLQATIERLNRREIFPANFIRLAIWMQPRNQWRTAEASAYYI